MTDSAPPDSAPPDSAPPDAAPPDAAPPDAASSDAAPSDTASLRARDLRRAAILIALVGLADWLFYAERAGLSLACFLALLPAAALLANPVAVPPRRWAAAGGLLALSLLPLLENPSLIACLFGFFGAAHATYGLTAGAGDPPGVRAVAALRLLYSGPPHCVQDLLSRRRHLAALVGAARPARALALWAVPLLLGGAFVLLFAAANPVIERWLEAVELDRLADFINRRRLTFWLLVAMLLWSFVFLRRRRARAARPPVLWTRKGATDRLANRFLGEATVLRSLLLFNALFAVQTGLDALYLWGGVALPEGMSYAAYAHRGAYPLIATALLAGGFVILAVRPGEATTPAARRIRALVYLWIAQNLLLVVSSLLRLDLYVAVYSLTELRAAAFVWMLLVLAGLGLLVLRILLRRSNRWLVGANLAVLVLTLYACCFVNFPRVIAFYNVTHSRDLTGEGEWLDWDYLVGLGPQAIPAIDAYDRALTGERRARWINSGLAQERAGLARRLAEEGEGWRAWSFRDWRLSRYLDEEASRGR